MCIFDKKKLLSKLGLSLSVPGGLPNLVDASFVWLHIPRGYQLVRLFRHPPSPQSSLLRPWVPFSFDVGGLGVRPKTRTCRPPTSRFGICEVGWILLFLGIAMIHFLKPLFFNRRRSKKFIVLLYSKL